ncbi:MAG: hypothetical protein HKN36_00955 [Hellea sp.]|nr:hypothetical protein [Hellea sp.]
MSWGDAARKHAEIHDKKSESARKAADKAHAKALAKLVAGTKDALITALGTATSNVARREAVEAVLKEVNDDINKKSPEDNPAWDMSSVAHIWGLMQEQNLLKALADALKEVETHEAARDAFSELADGLDTAETAVMPQ